MATDMFGGAGGGLQPFSWLNPWNNSWNQGGWGAGNGMQPFSWLGGGSSWGPGWPPPPIQGIGDNPATGSGDPNQRPPGWTPPRIPPPTRVPPGFPGGGGGFMPPPPIQPIGGGGFGGGIMTDTPQTPTLQPQTFGGSAPMFNPNPSVAPNMSGLPPVDASGRFIGSPLPPNPSFLGNMDILRQKFAGWGPQVQGTGDNPAMGG